MIYQSTNGDHHYPARLYPDHLSGTVDDDNAALGHEFGLSGGGEAMLLADHNDGIPGAYPLALDGCGSGLPSEYCEGATGSSGALGVFEMGNLPLYSYVGIGAIVGYFLGGKKLSSAAFGAAGGALLTHLILKK
jgi:hypothetical protein